MINESTTDPRGYSIIVVPVGELLLLDVVETTAVSIPIQSGMSITIVLPPGT